MGDVPDQPHPLTGQDLSEWKERIERARRASPGYRFVGVTPADLARLVATVEAQATQLAAAQAVIREWDEAEQEMSILDREYEESQAKEYDLGRAIDARQRCRDAREALRAIARARASTEGTTT